MGTFLPPFWFSLNNSETVKAVTLAFYIIQYLFIRDIHAKFGIPNLPQSPDFGQNSDWSIFDFQISVQPLINKNCHNSRTRNDIDMKLELVTKCNDRKTETSNKFDDEVMSAFCDIIVIFRTFGQFGAISKSDSGCIVYDIYIFINSNF